MTKVSTYAFTMGLVITRDDEHIVPDQQEMTIVCDRCGYATEPFSVESSWRRSNVVPWVLDHAYNCPNHPFKPAPPLEVST